MIKLNRTTEYGLIALRHMFAKQLKSDVSVTSAREVAEIYCLPFEITAKTLQKLKDTGIIQSEQGARGGYTLKRELSGVTLGEFLDAMEGPQSVVGCATHMIGTTETPKPACEYESKCEMKGVMLELNDKIKGFLAGIPLTDLTEFKDAVPAALNSLTTSPTSESTSLLSPRAAAVRELS